MRRQGQRLLVAAVITVPVLLFCAPSFRNLHNLNSDEDWVESYAVRNAILHHSVRTWGELPLWTPYVGGGYPVVGEPDDPGTSPLSVFTVWLAAVVGMKVQALLAHLVLAWGTYYYCRAAMGFAPAPAAFTGLAMGLSSWVPGRVLGGNMSELPYPWWPLAAALFVQSVSSRRHLVLCALVLAALLPQGKTCWAVLMLFLAILALLRSVRLEGRGLVIDGRWLRNLALVTAAAVALAGVKVLPMLSLLSEFRHSGGLDILGHARYYSPASMWVLSWGQMAQRLFSPAHVSEWRAASGVCVGAGVVGLAALGLVARGWREWRTVALLALAVCLMQSWRCPVDLFRWLWLLPVYNAIAVPTKYFNFFVLFHLVILAGLAVAWLWERARTRRSRALLTAGCVLALAHTFALNVGIQADLYPRDPPEPRPQQPFFQVRSILLNRIDAKPALANAYMNAAVNVGTIDWRTGLVRPERAAPRWFVDGANNAFPNPGYRGEAYLLQPDGSATLERLTSNSIVVRVKTDTPARTLVLNQCYHPAWRTSHGPAQSHDGLLAVRVKRAGHQRVRLHFRPLSIHLGAGLSLLAAAIAVVCLVTDRGRPRRAGLCRVVPRAALARPGTWLVLGVGTGLLAAAGVGLWRGVVRPRFEADDAYHLGRMAMSKGNSQSADYHLQTAVAAAPNHVDALKALARIPMGQGRPDRAIPLLAKALDLSPSDTAAELVLGWCAFETRHTAQALQHAQHILDRAPYHPEAHMLAAVCHTGMGQDQAAVDALAAGVDCGAYMMPEFDTLLESSLARLRDNPRVREIEAAAKARRHQIEHPSPNANPPPW